MTLRLGLSLGFAIGQGGGGGPSQVLLAIATRGVGPSGIIPLGGAGDSNYTRFESRLLHYSGVDPITSVQMVLPAFYMPFAGGEAAMVYPYTGQIAVEYSGQVKMITWDGGATSKSVPVSPVGKYASDVTALGFTIPPNTAFFVQTGAVVASGNILYATDTRAAGTTNDTFFRSTAAVSQVGTPGPWTTPPGGNNSNVGGCFSPMAIFALRNPSSKAAVLLGDSILAFTGDQGGDGNGNAGYPARACYLGDGTNKLPYTKLGRPSETASNMVGVKGDVRRSMFPGHSILVSEFGTNDMGQACATVTPTPQNKATAIANLQSNLQTAIWAPAKAAGLKVYQTLYTPRVLGPTITSLTSAGTTTCTATVASNADLPVNGSSITIVGAAPSAYSGTFTVTSVNTGTNQFTYAAGSVPGSSPATVSSNAVITWNDGFTTSTYQRPVDGYEPGGALRDTMNTWIKSKVADGTIDGYFDPNPGLEVFSLGVGTGIFLTSGGARTADGLHPNALGASGAATQIAADLYAAA